MIDAWCEDDRGRRVRALDPGDGTGWPVAGDPRIEAMIERAGRPRRKSGKARRIGELDAWSGSTVAATFAVGIGVLTLLAWATHGMGLPEWVPLMGAGLSGGAAAALVRRAWVRRHVRHLVAEVLTEGLCGSCGYNLHGSAAAADGCVVCAECGAAWRATRIVRSGPLGGEAGEASLKFGDIRPLLAARSTAMDATRATLDVRGVEIQVAEASLETLIALCPDAAARARLERLGAALLRRSRWWRWPLAAVGIGLVGWAWWPPGMGTGTALLTLGGLILAWLPFTGWGVPAMIVREALLAERLCVGCGSELPTPRELGDVVACGRCGAAWRA